MFNPQITNPWIGGPLNIPDPSYDQTGNTDLAAAVKEMMATQQTKKTSKKGYQEVSVYGAKITNLALLTSAIDAVLDENNFESHHVLFDGTNGYGIYDNRGGMLFVRAPTKAETHAFKTVSYLRELVQKLTPPLLDAHPHPYNPFPHYAGGDLGTKSNTSIIY